MERNFLMRGVIGMAATWALGLCTVATSLLVGGLLTGVVPSTVFGPAQILELAGRTLLVGGVAGALFALGLARTGRHTAFSALTERKVAVWGFLGAAAATLGLVAAVGGTLPIALRLTAITVYGLLGAGSGVGILRVARRQTDPVLRQGDTETSRFLPR